MVKYFKALIYATTVTKRDFFYHFQQGRYLSVIMYISIKVEWLFLTRDVKQ